MNCRSNRWTFTIANPGEWRPDWNELSDNGAVYMIYQLEIAPTTGTPHLQGYVRFDGVKRGATVKRWLRPEAHLEKARGDEKSNKEYCSKDESRAPGALSMEFGEYDATAGKQGNRSDLEAIRDKIKAGHSIADLADEHPSDFIRYSSGIQNMHAVLAPRPAASREVQVCVLWGPTGVGKTHRIMTAAPDAYQVEPGRDPWGRYNGEELVCFDEFDYTKWTIQQMNRFLDKWRCPLDARYRDRYAAWTRVVILANCSPLTWWPDAPLPLIESIRRRIQGHVFHITTRDQDLDDAHDESCDNLVQSS